MSRAIKKIPYKFVHVFWIDITSDSSWRSIEDVKEESLPRCLSTGFLISDEEDVIRLVSDFNFKEDGSIDECKQFHNHTKMCSSRSQRGFLNEFVHTRFCDLYHRSFIYDYSLNHDE